jgi:hypothetical protein
MNRATWTVVWLVLVLSWLAKPSLVAQSGLEVRGVVTDETGGLIVGASITLTDERGTRTTASTDTHGRYRLAAETLGKATLTIESPGFAPDRRTITLNGNTTVDVKLRVAVNEHVDVLGGMTRISLDSDQNLSGIRLTGKALEALPDDPENLLQSLRLLASSTGTRLDNVKFYVDGMPMTMRLPPKDVIESIRINADPFSAEFAEPGAGRVEILSKPASQHYHGNMRMDFNDSSMNSRDVFDPGRASYQTRTYEGYVGGPVVPNRWGFLAYGGRWDQDDNVFVNATTIDPVALQPQDVNLHVAAPTRTTSYSLRNDVRVNGHHTFAFEYAQNQQSRTNQGLQSGFDLPERAYNGTTKEQTGSFWVTSTFPTSVNEVRVRATASQIADAAITTSPAILVQEAFNAGGNQDVLARQNTTNTVHVEDVFTLNRPHHTFRFGGLVDVANLDQIDRSNFNGTFTFGSDVVRDQLGNPVLDAKGQTTAISGLDQYGLVLAGTPGYHPSQFSIVTGDPAISYSVYQGAWFAQDDWRPASRMTVSYGIRHELQGRGRQWMQFAPRASLAWSPSADGSSAVRVGIGLFHTMLPPALFSDVLRLDGLHGQQFVINQPAFFPAVPPALDTGALIPTIRTQSSDLTLPSMLISTISYDHQLTGGLFGSIGYSWRRGTNLLRTRDLGIVTAPGLGASAMTLQFESTGRSSAQEVNASLNGTIGSSLTVFGSYTWTKAYQDTDDLYTVPADSSNLPAEWGVAPIPRHKGSFGAMINLPDDYAIYPLFTWASELPFNITTGYDLNNDSVFADRPSLVAPGTPGAVATPYGSFNLTPAPGDPIIARNFGIGPTLRTFDVTGTKMFAVYHGVNPGSHRVTFSLSVTNLLNQTNYVAFNGVLTSPFFGTANSALNKRRITVSMRYDF